MSKRHNYKVFIAPKTEIYELAYQLVNGSSTRYHNLKLIPDLVGGLLTDHEVETLIREIMQILDIGAIESTHLRKFRFDAALRNNAATEEFKNLDISQYIPTTR